MAETTAPSQAESVVQTVYTERPYDEEPESFHVRILSSVLGGEEAAKDALLYGYKTAASGFSAKLTPQQVDKISSLMIAGTWQNALFEATFLGGWKLNDVKKVAK